MLRMLLLILSTVFACSVHTVSTTPKHEHQEQDSNFVVTIEKRSEAPNEKSSSTTFKVFLANDFKVLTEVEWEQFAGNNYKNYPNPFSPTSTLGFKIQSQDSVSIQLYNSKKRFIAELFEGLLTAGNYLLKITQPKTIVLPAGIYFCIIDIGIDERQVKRLVLLK